MKKIITYFLLGLYLHAAFAVYMPVVHYVLNYDFYKNVLCENKTVPELKCNGKCYLAKEIKVNQQQTNDAELPVPRIDFSKLPISIIQPITSYHLQLFVQKKEVKHTYLEKRLNTVYLNTVTPPPNYC